MNAASTSVQLFSTCKCATVLLLVQSPFHCAACTCLLHQQFDSGLTALPFPSSIEYVLTRPMQHMLQVHSCPLRKGPYLQHGQDSYRCQPGPHNGRLPWLTARPFTRRELTTTTSLGVTKLHSRQQESSGSILKLAPAGSQEVLLWRALRLGLTAAARGGPSKSTWHKLSPDASRARHCYMPGQYPGLDSLKMTALSES